MAGRVSTQEKKKKNLQAIKDIWGRSTPAQWIDTLKTYCPNKHWTPVGTHALKGVCPFHPDTDPSFHINLDRGIARCFGCEVSYTDPAKLLADACKMPYNDVIKDIVDGKWGIPIGRALTLQIRADQEEQELQRALQYCFSNVLIQGATRPSEEEFAYCQPAIAFLTKRQIPITPALLQELPIGIFPHKKHLMQYVPRDKFNAAIDYLGPKRFDSNPTEILTYTGGITFAYYSSPTNIGRFKLRQVPSITNPQDDKPIIWLGKEASRRGVFGLNMYQHRIGVSEVLYGVEGEFDFLSMFLAGRVSGDDELVLAAFSGHGLEELSFLKQFGFRKIVAVGDKDDGGVVFNRKVLENTSDIVCDIFDWSASSYANQAKIDPDDIVQQGGYDAFRVELLDPSKHIQRADWVADRVIFEVQSGAANSDARKAVLNNYADCAHDAVDRDRIIEQLNTARVISKTLVDQVYRATTTDEEYVFLIEDRLRQEVTPLMHKGDGIYVYCHRRRSILYAPMKRPINALSMISAEALETDIATWCRAQLGEPDWLKYEVRDDAKYPRSILARDQDIENLFMTALKKVFFTQVPYVDDVQECGAGVHYLGHHSRAVQADPGLKKRLFVVNGLDVYQGIIGGPNIPTSWEKLAVPKYKHSLLFNPYQREKWSNAIKDIDSLKKPAQEQFGLSPMDTLDQAYTMCTTGWRISKDLRTQRMESIMFTGLILYYPVVALFPFMNQTFVQADYSSGKSTLLMGFIGGQQMSEINVVEHSMAWDNWTSAGISQALSRTKMVGVIDEFENPSTANVDPARAAASRNLLQATRGNSRGAISSVRGTVSGDPRSSSFSTALLGGGIHEPLQHVDRSRWNIIHIEKDSDFRGDPINNIRKHFTLTQIKKIRYCITLQALQNAGSIMESYELVKKFAYRPDLPKGADNRLINNLLPIMAVLHWAGYEEWAGETIWDFFKAYLEYKVMLRKEHQPNEAEQFLIDTLTTPAIRENVSGIKLTVASLLADKTGRADINLQHCGVYYDSSTETVVLHIRQVLLNLLSQHPSYRGESHATLLRQRLLQVDTMLSLHEMKKRKVLPFLQRCMGTRKVKINEIVACPLSDLITVAAVVSR